MNQPTPSDFALDPRIAANTHFVAALRLCDVLLMNDSRFPWLILVPRINDAVEITHLSEEQKTDLWNEVDQASRALLGQTHCDKLNVGALGNIVRQLHVHVIARFTGDAAWPGPVWGAGTAIPYSEDDTAQFLQTFRTNL